MNIQETVNAADNSLWKKMAAFAIPLFGIAVLNVLFGYWKSNVLASVSGEDFEAVIAAGLANNVIFPVELFGAVFSVGFLFMAATAFSAGDRDKISRTAHTSVALSLIGGAAVMIFLEIFAGPLTVQGYVNGMSASVIVRIAAFEFPFLLLLYCVMALYLGSGNSIIPLLVYAGSGYCGHLFQKLLSAVFHLPVQGYALAGVIMNAMAALILFCSLPKTEAADLKISFSKLKLDREILAGIVRIGLPVGIAAVLFYLYNNQAARMASLSAGTNMAGPISRIAAAHNILTAAAFAFGLALLVFIRYSCAIGKTEVVSRLHKIIMIEGMIVYAVLSVIILFVLKSSFQLSGMEVETEGPLYQMLYIVLAAGAAEFLAVIELNYLCAFGISIRSSLVAAMVPWILYFLRYRSAFANGLGISFYTNGMVLCSVVLAIAFLLLIWILRPATKYAGDKV